MVKSDEEGKRARNPNQVERILTILRYLQGGWYSIEELLELFPGFSKRTFYRDIEQIKENLGNAIQVNLDGEMHFMPNGALYLQSLDLTYMEAFSLYLLCQMTQKKSSSAPYLQSVVSVMQKLRCLTQNQFPESMDTQIRHTEIEISPTAYPKNEEIFIEVFRALEQKVSFLVEYDSIYDKQVIQTLISPYHLHFTRRAWYVTGRSSFHHEIRTFHLERIQTMKVIPDATFVIPIGWTYEKFRGNAWNMIRDSEEVDVVLKFSKMVARNVASVNWHKTQTIQKLPDGSIEFRVRVAGTREILWWILGYGDQVEVVEPPELRKAIREKIGSMMKIYEKDGFAPPIEGSW